MDDTIIGQKFGELLVLNEVPKDIRKDKNHRCFECQCSCGSKTIVTLNHLKTGHTKSCGCMKGKMCSIANTKHGMTGSRIYQIWLHMKHRCFNPKDKEYHRYGGRGISICDEWINNRGFENFYNWAINNDYQEDLTIDRINNDDNYEPNNCRWVNRKEQMNNVGYNIYLRLEDKEHTIAQWSDILGIKQNTIQARKKYHNYDDRAALLKPPTCQKKVRVTSVDNKIKIDFNSCKEASEYIGCDRSSITQCAQGKIKSTHGYYIEYIEEEYNLNLASDNQYAERL